MIRITQPSDSNKLQSQPYIHLPEFQLFEETQPLTLFQIDFQAPIDPPSSQAPI